MHLDVECIGQSLFQEVPGKYIPGKLSISEYFQTVEETSESRSPEE